MDEKLKRPDLKSDKWQKQASGLEIWDEKVGVGEAVKAGANVKVHYTGWLTDDKATIFDSSEKENTAAAEMLTTPAMVVVSRIDNSVELMMECSMPVESTTSTGVSPSILMGTMTCPFSKVNGTSTTASAAVLAAHGTHRRVSSTRAEMVIIRTS